MGIFLGGGTRYVGPKPVSYLFIDGGYFRKVLEDFSLKIFGDPEPVYPDFDFVKRFGHPQSTKVFYYDCPVPRKNGESAEAHKNRLDSQENFFNSLRFLDGYHLFIGATVGPPGKERQKQVDVKIAVDMLMHAHRGNMSHCTLLAGDQDFKPVIDALVQEGINTKVWYKNGSTSRELIYAADAKEEFSYQSIYNLLPLSLRKDVPFPTCQTTSRDTSKMKLLSSQNNQAGETISIFQSEKGRYFIVEPMPKPLEPNRGKFYSCNDIKLLQKYYELENGKVVWKNIE